MQLRHDPTFFWATSRLPRDVRPAVHALYGYVRGADELVDGPRRPPDPDARRARAGRVGARARRGPPHRRARTIRSSPRSSTPGERHDLPLDELGVYMDSMRVDCGPVRIASREELDRYMNGSAAAVGRHHGAAARLRTSPRRSRASAWRSS